MSETVVRVDSWEALDSRGRPTVAARVVLSDGSAGTAIVPSGASAGSHEAHELRDGGTRYSGRGVRRAVANVATVLAERILRLQVDDVDDALAAAVLDVQDFLVVPVGAQSLAETLEWSVAVRDSATRLGLSRGHQQAVLVADEGGLGLPLNTNRAALELLTDAIEAAGFDLGTQLAIAMDVAATEFYREGRYHLACEGRTLDAAGLIAELGEWSEQFPIVSIDDPLAEDDWDGWRRVTAALGDRVELVGDDLFVTSVDRLQRGIDEQVANSVLVKVNQNGLVSGARKVVDRARGRATGPWCQRARVSPRTAGSPTSPWDGEPARSRSDRPNGPSAPPSGTGCSSWKPPRPPSSPSPGPRGGRKGKSHEQQV